MICPNCQMQQPQNNLAYCVRCNYPLQSRPQGFFSKSSQTGYSRADAYSAARRGQPQQVAYPAQQQPPPAERPRERGGERGGVQRPRPGQEAGERGVPSVVFAGEEREEDLLLRPEVVVDGRTRHRRLPRDVAERHRMEPRRGVEPLAGVDDFPRPVFFDPLRFHSSSGPAPRFKR